ATQDPHFVPVGWKGLRCSGGLNVGDACASSSDCGGFTCTEFAELYTSLVAHNCRTCHVAFTETKDFNQARDFVSKAKSRACDSRPEDSVNQQRNMPHAFISYRNFWTNYEGLEA